MSPEDTVVRHDQPTPPDRRAALGTSDEPGQPAVADLTYEQARDELVQVVARLEAGGEPLEASLALWERGESLAARCQEWLDGARERLEAARSEGSTGQGGATEDAEVAR